MKKTHPYLATVILAMFLGALAFTQESSPDKATVPFSNPSKPGMVEANVYSGSITVKGYEGKEVIVEARLRGKVVSEEKKEPSEKAAGMKLIQVAATGLTVEEKNNVMEISAESYKNTVDLAIQVPHATSLKLGSYRNGEIVVENVSGEIEVENYQGPIKVTGVSGAVVANTYNGNVTVTLTKVAPDKPMSFSTWRGDIDVTLPADVKANVKMKSERGDIYSDFEVKILPAPQKDVEKARKEEGKYKISFGRYIYGKINGGGPEFQFNNYSGDIFIRRAK